MRNHDFKGVDIEYTLDQMVKENPFHHSIKIIFRAAV